MTPIGIDTAKHVVAGASQLFGEQLKPEDMLMPVTNLPAPGEFLDAAEEGEAPPKPLG